MRRRIWHRPGPEEGGLTVPDQDPNSRVLQARLAAHHKWANTTDATAATQPGRDKFMARFELEVDPDGSLSPEERARRAEHARKAYFLGLALKSAKARKAGKRAAEAAELHAIVDEITGGAA